MIENPDIYGFCGIAILILCYGRVQWQRDYAKRVNYSLLNLLSGILLFIAVVHRWNAAACAGVLAWVAISCYGLYRCIKYIRLQNERKRWWARRPSKG